MRVRKQTEDQVEMECPELPHAEIRKAIIDNPFNLGVFWGELTEDDWDVCLAAVEKSGFTLENVPDDIQKAHPEICETAIRQSGHIGLGEDERGFPSDMLIAHVRNPTPELFSMAVAKNGMALEYVPQDYQTEVLCMEAVMNNPFAVRFVHIDGEAYERVAMAAINANPSALEFVQHQTPRLCMAAIEADGICLRFIKNHTDEMFYAAVCQDGMAIEFILNQNEELCMAAINQNPFAIIHVCIDDEDAYERICLAAVRRNPTVIEYVSPQTLKICLAVVSTDGMLLQYIKNPPYEVCMAAVRNCGPALQFIEDQTILICLAAMLQDTSAIKYVNDIVRADILRKCSKEMAANGHLRFMEKDVQHMLPMFWKCAEIREDVGIMDVLADIININPHFLKYVERQTKDICMMAVKLDGLALKHVKHKCLLANDYAEICMTAVKQNCNAFKYVKISLENPLPFYDQICKEAIKRNGSLIEFVHGIIIKNYSELALEAVRQYGENLQYVSREFCSNDYMHICLNAVRNDGMALKYIYDQTPEIFLAALRQNKNVFWFVSNSLWNLLKTFDSKTHGEISEMMKHGKVGGYCEKIAAKIIEFLEKIVR